MFFKKNEGYVGVDASLAIIILLIFIPTMASLIYGINISTKASERKASGLNIMINVLETAKLTEMNDTYLETLQGSFESIYGGTNLAENTITFSAEDNEQNRYSITVEVTDYADGKENVQENVVKTVKVTAKDKLNTQEKELDISTVVT